MKEKIKQILEGWSNLALDKLNLLDKETVELGEKRIVICNTCDMRVNNVCSTSKKGEVKETFIYKITGEERKKGNLYPGCSCNLFAKTICKDCQCPLNKW